ncbi:hypothetical protein Q4Q34_06315 [Flavivirga abyssicola]|uniref:hypothetical protein n=1 Tax=Flavivirga abyssicola TaxID=3063533 RepID=UPI0026DF705F|nr:hypothetical protein [Flavivirga sp. MEBiC07777]WVK14641.1 hypothetical protein Q4Q34_06315 [Flavivirga sp. MEBiC07777]
MTVINQLSSSLGQKGNDANITLAKEIAEAEDRNAIKELVENLKNKDKKIQADCIKTLYETAYIKPDLIANYYKEFLNLLSSKNNRLIWGGMIALATITDLKSKELFESIDLISDAVGKGSVITVDSGIEIFAKLNKHSEYQDKVENLLTDQLWKCPSKQLPQYMEKSTISINEKNKEIYQKIINIRKSECEKESQLKRLDKVWKLIEKI